MEFQRRQLKTDLNGQAVSIPCVLLSEPEDEHVWIHLEPAPPIVMQQCLQLIPLTHLI